MRDEDCVRELYNDSQEDEADDMDTWIVFKSQNWKWLYVCDFDEHGNPILTENRSKAFKFHNFAAALSYNGYTIMKG